MHFFLAQGMLGLMALKNKNQPTDTQEYFKYIWIKAWQNLQMSRGTTKPTKWPVRPAMTQISLGIRPVFAVRMKKALVLSYPLSTQRRLIRLGRCTGWSESSLGAPVSLFVLSWGDSNGKLAWWKLPTVCCAIAIVFTWCPMGSQGPSAALCGQRRLIRLHEWFCRFFCAQTHVDKESISVRFTRERLAESSAVYINKCLTWYLSCSMKKPTKWRVPSEDSDQPGHPPRLISLHLALCR